MDIKLKHRLVGACVILALAVFFLPMILDSEKYRQDIESQIPTDSVLQNNVSDSAEQSSSAQSGSLTIDLDEDEPVKAIKKPSQHAKNVAENGGNDSESEKPDPLKVESGLDETTAKSHDKPAIKAVEPATPAAIADDSQSKTSNATESADKTKQSEPKTTVAKTSGSKASKNSTTLTSKNNPQKTQAVDTGNKKTSFEETAWVIQIGSFSNKENATALVSELRNKGYRAYQRDAGKYSRVYVGPYPDKSAAESRVKPLEDIVGSAVKVLQFDPQGH
ncbi:hypothetical protein GCM10009123_20370 [Kangiella japonica]|uniref:SPOR domain-containing protein n=1 Tax=Kangiella japonica TaxID=647384 RepID=A0ABN0T599_9GAMM